MEFPFLTPRDAIRGAAPPALPTPGASAAHPGEFFHFHPRASNPELWRTTVPLVVRLRCGRHKGLVATWTAIHWLIVLYAASGRCAFGMREIAQEAGVGRNELAGPTGHIQRLVDLGLLSIVGYEPVPGVKQPRPIYAVDLADLERQSLELVPALLCERQLPPPPRPAPDPRQMALFHTDVPDFGTALGQPMHETGTEAVAPDHGTSHGTGTGVPTYRARPRLRQSRGHETKPEAHGNGTVRIGDDQATAPSRARLPETGTDARPSGAALAPIGARMPETGTVTHGNLTDHARNRDVERRNEEKERTSEIAHAHEFHQIVAATAQTVIRVLQQQGIVAVAPAAPITPAAPASLEHIPAAPAGQVPLRASVLTLWQGDRASLSSRERNQLALVADSYDASTGGFGAYWLGRAILLADLCLSERGRPLSLSYVRGMLRRWAQEGSWGSDLTSDDGAAPADTVRPQRRRPSPSAGARPAPVIPADDAADPVTGAMDHPAINAYEAAFGPIRNQVQAEQIAATVTDLAIWRRVLTDWQANGWQPGAVAKMLDRYHKDTGLTAAPAREAAPSVRVIHTYPGLDLDQRERWIRKFHAALTPAEKRAVIARLEQEHPHD